MNDPWKYFPECPPEMDPEFMSKLIGLREALGKPMRITSSYRTPEKNKEVGGVENSPHLLGRAVDIGIYGKDALDLLILARKYGMTGIGVNQRGPTNKRFVHVDDCADEPGRPRPWLWSY